MCFYSYCYDPKKTEPTAKILKVSQVKYNKTVFYFAGCKNMPTFKNNSLKWYD